jgi:hypothetical protein
MFKRRAQRHLKPGIFIEPAPTGEGDANLIAYLNLIERNKCHLGSDEGALRVGRRAALTRGIAFPQHLWRYGRNAHPDNMITADPAFKMSCNRTN